MVESLEEDEELAKILARKAKQLASMKPEKPSAVSAVIDRPITVTDQTFDEFINSKSPPVKVVDFWAEWCGPCRYMEPVIEQLAKEWAGKVIFGKLNVDENPYTTQRFEVMSIPTMIVFKNGEPVHVIVGAMPKPALVKQLEPFID
jgi:thioredoxin 1